ncbi:DUF4865 family protein [Hafnia psychrotolerans]|uniref:DUF4865 domain-containing protein n=1 Tax=Hafnia psychrotolerans TaxID=1477018 RepID=A0ABQ1GQM3_9GAMM|nr:DUF4865 family protein [Hafnia psychrotolerans]GGA48238.1 DUF4865 domain-containing protein [Hafnia psychrotolerans]
MIAMQYSFTLPADYDMGIIEKRITDNGHLLDGYPGLIFKTYLYARLDDMKTGSTENLYAPFYLWRDAESLNHFLISTGFQGVAKAFGWPQVRTYPVVAARLSDDIADAVFATREISDIAPFSALSQLVGEPTLDALIDIVAWDTTNWKKIHFTAGKKIIAGNGQHYRIKHISLPLQANIASRSS